MSRNGIPSTPMSGCALGKTWLAALLVAGLMALMAGCEGHNNADEAPRGGAPLAADFAWSFTTGAGSDTTDLRVTSINPADLAVTVSTNQKIAVTFNEGLDPSTLTAATFALTGPGATPVPGAGGGPSLPLARSPWIPTFHAACLSVTKPST